MQNQIYYQTVNTPLGVFAFVYRENKILHSYLPLKNKALLMEKIHSEYSMVKPGKDAWGEMVAQELINFAKSEESSLASIALDYTGSPPFYKKVWQAVHSLRPGETLSYGAVAKKIGAPKAARAVGQAMGKNKFAPFVPCHRVLAANKAPGGFSAFRGLALKAEMLELEGVKL